MGDRTTKRARGFTLLEVSLAAALLAVLAALVVPNLYSRMLAERLPTSAEQMQSMVAMVRAHAQFDGLRYRIRFPKEDEDEENILVDDRQPLIEREDDPIEEPGVFNLVAEPWATGETLLSTVWCAEVRLGRPTATKLLEERDVIQDVLVDALEDYDPLRPPLIIETDGTSDWATFVLTEADRDLDIEELEDEIRIEVITDGEMGLSWVQRPFYEEELEMFEERGWPVVLRQDFMDQRVLTEDDVLEMLETWVE